MRGLKEAVRGSLRLLRPGDLELARDIEDNLSVQAGGCSFRSFNNSPVQRSNNFSRPVPAASGNLGSSTSNPPRPADRPPITRPRFTCLSPQDYADLRAKGLCYHCKKPYTPGHECPLKQLRVLLAEEDADLDMDFQNYELIESTGQELPVQ